ncbi:MAG TPA: hypothetical protein VHQ90_16715 [Thermoanaerobaculia bacterium]|nr:hypothetical protein [Thermoanaerobaculia bacterium]
MTRARHAAGIRQAGGAALELGRLLLVLRPRRRRALGQGPQGTALNGHFWIIYDSLTDVEFDLTVTDNLSPTGAARAYHNPAHHLASAADTSAF